MTQLTELQIKEQKAFDKVCRASWRIFYKGMEAAKNGKPLNTDKSELWQDGWKHYKKNWRT